jgi:hypothetical protein
MPDAQRFFRDLKRYEAFDQSNKPGGWNASEVSHLVIDEILEHGSCRRVLEDWRTNGETHPSRCQTRSEWSDSSDITFCTQSRDGLSRERSA